MSLTCIYKDISNSIGRSANSEPARSVWSPITKMCRLSLTAFFQKQYLVNKAKIIKANTWRDKKTFLTICLAFQGLSSHVAFKIHENYILHPIVHNRKGYLDVYVQLIVSLSVKETLRVWHNVGFLGIRKYSGTLICTLAYTYHYLDIWNKLCHLSWYMLSNNV